MEKDPLEKKKDPLEKKKDPLEKKKEPPKKKKDPLEKKRMEKHPLEKKRDLLEKKRMEKHLLEKKMDGKESSEEEKGSSGEEKGSSEEEKGSSEEEKGSSGEGKGSSEEEKGSSEKKCEDEKNSNKKRRKKSIKNQLGSIYSKLANPFDIVEPKSNKNTNTLKYFLRFCQKCRMRTGTKRTQYKWNGDHPFVNGTKGLREIWYYIPFKKVFPYGRPNVEVALSGLDTNKDNNLRINSTVVWRRRFGFVLKISTWLDTKIYMAKFSYTVHFGCN